MSLDNATIANTIEDLISEIGNGPIMIHADLLRATFGRRQSLSSHMEILTKVGPNRIIWMPTFNYGFTKNGKFDVQNDISEVGPITEYFRTTHANWRTSTPIFSFSGTGPFPIIDSVKEIDPFGSSSIFAELVKLDGIVLFYGAPFSSATILHYAERQAGGPTYRYDKLFPGKVFQKDGSYKEVNLIYHVRPQYRRQDYDWPRLFSHALASGDCHDWENEWTRIIAVSARQLTTFWDEMLTQDPLYLLDACSRTWVEPMLNSLGRRFELCDFEDDPV